MSNLPEDATPRRPPGDASLLALIANGLLAIFVIAVLFQAVPLQILDPAWQLRMVGTITANGGVAITGFALLHLAANLQPQSQRLADRRRFARRWALVAAVGFLLLVPLQGYAVWNGITLTRAAQVRQRSGVSQGIERVRQAVARATSVPDLQQQLLAVQGPTLTPNALQRPLPEVKQALLKEAGRVEQQLRARPLGPTGGELWTLVQDNLRTVLLAVIFAICFAGGSQLPGAAAPTTTGLPMDEAPSMLDQLGGGLRRSWRGLRPGKRPKGGLEALGVDEELQFRSGPGRAPWLRLPKLGSRKANARKRGPSGRR